MAAILNFKLSVSSRATVQHYHYPYLIVGPRKHRYNCCNFVAILHTSRDICRHLGFSTSGFLLISAYHQYNTKGMSLAGNVVVAIKNVFPPRLVYKSEDILHVIHCSQVVFTTSACFKPPFWASDWC